MNDFLEDLKAGFHISSDDVTVSCRAKALLAVVIAFVFSFLIAVAFLPTIGGVRPWMIVIFLGVIYLAFSWRWWDPIKENERATRIFFGQNAGDVNSGVPFAPLGLVAVRPIPINVTQREFPGNHNQVYHGDLSKNPDVDLEGKVLPIRIPFRSSVTLDEAKVLFGEENLTISNTRTGNEVTFNPDVPDDGLSDRITAELYMIVRFTPRDIYQFVRNIGDIDTAIEQIEDEMVSTATQFLGRMSYAQAIANMRWLDMILYKAVARRTGSEDGDNPDPNHSWGIELHDVRIKSIELDHTTNQKIRDAAAARFAASATVTDAEAEKKAITLRGEGTADAAKDLEQKTLSGRAAGQKELAAALGVSGAEVQAAEVARAIAEGGNSIIFGADGLAQAASVVGAMVNKKSPPESRT